MEGFSKVYTIKGSSVSADYSRNGYRLPTEAEWEYAARGGKQSRGYTYSGSNDEAQVAVYDGDSGNTTHAAGTKTPNELGLFDMSENVWEWCHDWYGDYSSGIQIDPRGPSSGTLRVLRGGSWDFAAPYLRVAARIGDNPSGRGSLTGFRVARPQFQ